MSQKQYHGENLFMQLEDWVVDILMSDQLTKIDHRLFWYLFKLERWGDRFVDLPSQSEIALQLGVRRETINQSQAKLQNLGLWDFKINGWKAKNLVGPKSNRVLDFSNTLLEKSNTLLDEDHSQLEKFNTNIYKDRACGQTNEDLKQTNLESLPPTPQGGEQPREGATEPGSVDVVEVEIVEPEESEPNLDPTATLEKKEDLLKTAEPTLEDKSFAACDKKTTNVVNNRAVVCDVEVLQSDAKVTHSLSLTKNSTARNFASLDPKLKKLLERYNRGEVGRLPESELKVLAGAVIGETVKLYRSSGQVLSGSPNDFDRSFLEFIAMRDKQDFVYATRLIGVMERTPSRWGELVELVTAWQIGDVNAIPRAAVHFSKELERQRKLEADLHILDDLE